jgi:hypothetical protein
LHKKTEQGGILINNHTGNDKNDQECLKGVLLIKGKSSSFFTLRESRVMPHLLCWQGFAVL